MQPDSEKKSKIILLRITALIKYMYFNKIKFTSRITPSIVSHILVFLNTIFITLIFLSWMFSDYESRVFSHLVDKVTNPEMIDEQKAIVLMDVVHKLLKPRSEIWSEKEMGLKEYLIESGTAKLIEGGACGSYVQVLALTLQECGIKVRHLSMTVGTVKGGHILLEAKINGKWAVLDPTYNLYYRKPDGSLASAYEVKENWTYFTSATPTLYNQDYSYKEYIYTNWEKVPLILPSVKKVLILVFGEEKIMNFSIRTYFYNQYKAWLWLLILIYIPILFFTIKSIISAIINKKINTLDSDSISIGSNVIPSKFISKANTRETLKQSIFD